ncbi:AbrB/MazE/SpoVT family DNA-binding domain-containing protein [Sellimonas catena]|uniref:Sucrose-6-phosphate hydrolase n=1 Tax=Sellimonas catena TaxID=2994035 RepID=A0A9W6FEJ7_9FIRM|nr:AbrB/MazE/SpoVT family DNA-binding domain-containing protein [Sellimonas catena]GLG88941.1 hypothetical protein Selli2_03670 [Sellimonas catena]
MTNAYIYLDTYILQQDMRIRLPKAILSNMEVEKGKTQFDIFLDVTNNTILMKIHVDNERENPNAI